MNKDFFKNIYFLTNNGLNIAIFKFIHKYIFFKILFSFQILWTLTDRTQINKST